MYSIIYSTRCWAPQHHRQAASLGESDPMTDGQVGAPSDKLLEIALGEFKGNYMATLG